MDVLADYKGHMQHLQIQCSGELDGIINRFWQHHLLQNLLEKSKMGVVFFSHPMDYFLICIDFFFFLINLLFFNSGHF